MSSQNILLPEQVQECQDLLNQLSCVLYTRFVLAADGSIAELHVLAGRARAPKQIVRDIQSALLARYGIEIDYKVISVAQIDAGENAFSAAAPVRLICSDVFLSCGKTEASARVTLSLGENLFIGEASGGTDLYSRQMMLASATINAVNRYLGMEAFRVQDVRTAHVAGAPAILVAVCFRGDILLGAARAEAFDSSYSVVRSALDAVNRRVCCAI